MALRTSQVQVELIEMPIQVLDSETSDDALPLQPLPLSKARSAAIIITIAGVSFLNTLGTGLLTVALPQIKIDLDLPSELLLWSVFIYICIMVRTDLPQQAGCNLWVGKLIKKKRKLGGHRLMCTCIQAHIWLHVVNLRSHRRCDRPSQHFNPRHDSTLSVHSGLWTLSHL